MNLDKVRTVDDDYSDDDFDDDDAYDYSD